MTVLFSGGLKVFTLKTNNILKEQCNLLINKNKKNCTKNAQSLELHCFQGIKSVSFKLSPELSTAFVDRLLEAICSEVLNELLGIRCRFYLV